MSGRSCVARRLPRILRTSRYGRPKNGHHRATKGRFAMRRNLDSDSFNKTCFGRIYKEVNYSFYCILKLSHKEYAWSRLPQLQTLEFGQLTHCVCNLLLILHVELSLLVGVIRNKVLMGVVVHLNEVTQGNFVISLSAGEYPCQKLIGGTGRRQGQ
jgi:hypothetical protein